MQLVLKHILNLVPLKHFFRVRGEGFEFQNILIDLIKELKGPVSEISSDPPCKDDNA